MNFNRSKSRKQAHFYRTPLPEANLKEAAF